jgi:DNA-binding transcriptional regulator YiaG
MQQPKVIATREIAATQEQFHVIEQPETYQIQKIPVTIQAQYWVPLRADLQDQAQYLLPLDDPDYNIQLAYAAFRKAAHYLTPTEMRSARQHLGLSLRETALILGLSYSTLSELETGKILQNQLQETALEMLLEPAQIQHLVQQRSYQLQQKLSAPHYQRICNKLQLPV